eukprot:545314_1
MIASKHKKFILTVQSTQSLIAQCDVACKSFENQPLRQMISSNTYDYEEINTVTDSGRMGEFNDGDLYDEWNTNIINNLDKLKPHIPEIIEYIKHNELDGAKLIKMNRKNFMKEAAAYCNDKKLTSQFGALYNAIIKCDILGLYDNDDKNEEEKLQQDIWSNNPQTISQCDVNQIVYILNNELDGAKLIKMNRKNFMKEAAAYCNDKKLTSQFGTLYNEIIKCDILGLYDNDDKNEEEKLQQDIWSNNPQTISQCDVNQIVYILNNTNIINNLDELKPHMPEIIEYINHNELEGDLYDEWKKDPYGEQTESWFGLFACSVLLIHFIVISMISAIKLSDGDCMNHIHFITTYEITMAIIMIVLLINRYSLQYFKVGMMKRIYSYNGFFAGMVFASYMSSTFIIIFNYSQCQDSIIWISMLILQIIGAMICLSLAYISLYTKCASFLYNKYTSVKCTIYCICILLALIVIGGSVFGVWYLINENNNPTIDNVSNDNIDTYFGFIFSDRIEYEDCKWILNNSYTGITDYEIVEKIYWDETTISDVEKIIEDSYRKRSLSPLSEPFQAYILQFNAETIESCTNASSELQLFADAVIHHKSKDLEYVLSESNNPRFWSNTSSLLQLYFNDSHLTFTVENYQN